MKSSSTVTVSKVHLKDAVVKVFTRRGNDWTNRFRKIAAASFQKAQRASRSWRIVASKARPTSPPVRRSNRCKADQAGG
jgi:hypothetical protein